MLDWIKNKSEAYSTVAQQLYGKETGPGSNFLLEGMQHTCRYYRARLEHNVVALRKCGHSTHPSQWTCTALLLKALSKRAPRGLLTFYISIFLLKITAAQ